MRGAILWAEIGFSLGDDAAEKLVGWKCAGKGASDQITGELVGGASKKIHTDR